MGLGRIEEGSNGNLASFSVMFCLAPTSTAKRHYIEPQRTGVNGLIYLRFEINHIH